MNNSLGSKWNNFFQKVDQAKIEYVRKKCKICRNKDINHYSECNHIELDEKLVRESVNRKLKKEAQEMLKVHCSQLNPER